MAWNMFVLFVLTRLIRGIHVFTTFSGINGAPPHLCYVFSIKLWFKKITFIEKMLEKMFSKNKKYTLEQDVNSMCQNSAVKLIVITKNR